VLVLGSFAESLINFRGPLLKAMVERGHAVIGCAPPGDANNVKTGLNAMGVEYAPVHMDRAGINPVADARTMAHLLSLFRAVKPDVVLSYTVKPVVYGSIAARLAGVGEVFSIITGLGYLFSGGRLGGQARNVLARFLYKLGLRGNRRVFFQNPDDRDFFERAGLLRRPEQAVLINGSGIDVDSFRPVPPPEGLSFLLIARLLRSKGIHEYAEAARIVKSRHSGIPFRLAGWIDESPDAIGEKELRRWTEGGTIEYLGRLNDVKPAISQSSVYVLPSYREGTPRTVLEAMAMGRPVITTDAPGCRETVQAGVNGFIVSVRDVAGLVEAMEKFVENPGLVSRMGERSRRIAEEKYDVRKVNHVILNAMNL
jgi:glycosyltransferase involved in cell wall biosynthesis